MSTHDVTGPLPEKLLCANCKLLLHTDTSDRPQEFCRDENSSVQPATQDHHPHQLIEFPSAKQIEEKLNTFDERFEEFVQGTQHLIRSVKDVVATLVHQTSTLRSGLDVSQNTSVYRPPATNSQFLPFEDPVQNEDLMTLDTLRLSEEALEGCDTWRGDRNGESVLHDAPLPKTSAAPDPDLEDSQDDEVERVFKKGVEEGTAGMTQARVNEKSLEQHELDSAVAKKKVDNFSTMAMSFMNDNNEGMLKTHPYAMETNFPTCFDGRFTWRIPDVAKKREEALANPSTPLVSPPWYTAPDGYKLRTHLYLNGNGTQAGSHVSIFLSVMKGEYDRILQWPLKGRMSFFLLDLGQKHWPVVQTRRSNPNSPSFQQPSPHSVMNIASGCPDFAPIATLDDKRYVDDDEMFIKCVMDVHS